MTYSISDLEQLSGIQSHTIRIWEQRYHALKPMRSEGNTRRYDDEQLKRLLNIVSLNQSGLKISKICKLSDAEMNQLLGSHLENWIPDEFEIYIQQLLKYGLAYDEVSYTKILDQCVENEGILSAYRNIMYPVLVRLGLMWRKDDICPAQEHFLSNLIRQKIYAAIDGLVLNPHPDQTWLLFLPEDEVHDIGLLFANYILKASGQKVIFLGAKVPLKSIANVLQQNEVHNLLFFLIRSRKAAETQDYCDALLKLCGKTNVHIAGNGQVIEQLQLKGGMHWFKSLEEFENTIQNVEVA